MKLDELKTKLIQAENFSTKVAIIQEQAVLNDIFFDEPPVLINIRDKEINAHFRSGHIIHFWEYRDDIIANVIHPAELIQMI